MTLIRKARPVWLVIAITAILSICTFLSINIARETGAASDFNVFWTAGNNFIHGNALYSGIGGACRFIYPPFAAFLFQFFALFPLQTAAAIFGITNFILYFLALYLTRKVFSFYTKDSRRLNIALFFAALISFRYYWYHFHFIQLNIAVFVLCLAGILFYLKGKETAAVGFFVFAAFIKVYPVFFLIWIIIRGSVRTSVIIMGFVLLFLFVPVVYRGFNRGTLDIKDYYTSFLQPFKDGRIEPQFHNHSLSSAIFKAFQPSNEGDGFDYRLFNVSVETTNYIYKISFLVLFGMMVFIIGRNRYRKQTATVYELSVVFLAMLLLCGITWEYHLVTMLFVYMSLITMNTTSLSKRCMYLRAFFLFCGGALALIGRDTVGDRLFHYFGGYNSLTILMLGLMLFFFFFDGFRQGTPLNLQGEAVN